MEGESQGGITRQGHARGGGGGGGQERGGEPKRHDEGCCDPLVVYMADSPDSFPHFKIN